MTVLDLSLLDIHLLPSAAWGHTAYKLIVAPFCLNLIIGYFVLDIGYSSFALNNCDYDASSLMSALP